MSEVTVAGSLALPDCLGAWLAADFATRAAQAFLAARPERGMGERADGLCDGLEMAARIVLSLAGVPAGGEG